MDNVNQVIGFLSSTTISVPLGQMILFILVISFCMIGAKFKLGLLITYVFVFYRGFIFNQSAFIDAAGQASMGLFAYTFFGVSMITVALIGLFIAPHS